MSQDNKMRIKDRLTIRMKQSKRLSLITCLVLSVIMLAVIVIFGFTFKINTVEPAATLTDDENQFHITITGDIQVSDTIRKMASKTSYEELLEGVKAYFQEADYVMANMSGPVLQYQQENYKSTRDKMEESIYLRPAAIRGFAKAGINLFAFANDDTYNYGTTGIESTIRVLEKDNYEYIGIASDSEEEFSRTLEFEGHNSDGETTTRSVAVLNINDNVRKYSTVSNKKAGIVNSSLGNLYEKVYELSQENDYVITYVHFYENTNTTSLEEQKTVAKALIDAGADIVIGNSESLHHVEKYREGLIAYSLGNFVSDVMYTNEKDSAMLDLIITKDNEVKAYFTPIRLQEGKPEVALSGIYYGRICSLLTSELDEMDYEITEEGMIEISLGALEDKTELPVE